MVVIYYLSMSLLHKSYIGLKAVVVDFFSYESLKSMAVIILCLIAFEALVFEPYKIPSGSMKPTLLVGDHIFVSKFTYGYGAYSLPGLVSWALPDMNFIKERVFFSNKPKRGDIVIFRGTQKDTKNITYIKRVIGLPGDKIQMLYGQLYINGVPTKLSKISEAYNDEQKRIITKFKEQLPSGFKYEIFVDGSKYVRDFPDTTHVYTVPEGHYFCMGDNRNDSIDSRFPKMGFIPEQNLVGRAYFLYWNSKDVLQAIKSFDLGRLFTVFNYAA